jgi:hypothetical protein
VSKTRNHSIASSEIGAQETNLITILEDRRGIGVQDPRDMLFAHVSIAGVGHQKLLSIDYTKTLKQVFEDLAIYLLSHGHYHILS